ncbi:hypothetical protein DLR74_18140 [Vibrio paracholerae]|nr:hypothetical protein DLR74_18140 [Vibrio paracholerae]
MKRQCTWRCNF